MVLSLYSYLYCILVPGNDILAHLLDVSTASQQLSTPPKETLDLATDQEYTSINRCSPGAGLSPQGEASVNSDKSSAGTKPLLGQVIPLGTLLDYQEGAVVSRTLIQKKTGTVTLFAFDKGQGLSEHTAPFEALVYLLDGEGEITISGKKHCVQAGEMILMPADEPHSLHALQPFKMVLIMLRS